MPIRLLVSRSASADAPDEYVFSQERVVLGRDSAADLTLPDQQRVISKQHAEIKRSGDAYELWDLGSKNFTYLNGKRVQAGIPYDLRTGDAVRLGEFEVTFEVTFADAPAEDRTVFDASFANPFEDDAAAFVKALSALRTRFEREQPARRADALVDALERAGAASGEDEVDVIIARAFGPAAASPSFGAYVDIPPQPAAEPAPYAREVYAAQPPYAAAFESQKGVAPATDAESGPLLDTFLRLFVRVAGMPGQFRNEFIGQTIRHTADSAALFGGDADALRDYLTEAVPAEEAERRRAQVESVAEDLALHQVGLLDGYRACVQQGTKALLDEMDPEAIEETVRQQGALNQLSSLHRKARVTDLLIEKKHELGGEDWSVAERRVFRPAFIKAYLSRLTSRK